MNACLLHGRRLPTHQGKPQNSQPLEDRVLLLLLHGLGSHVANRDWWWWWLSSGRALRPLFQGTVTLAMSRSSTRGASSRPSDVIVNGDLASQHSTNSDYAYDERLPLVGAPSSSLRGPNAQEIFSQADVPRQVLLRPEAIEAGGFSPTSKFSVLHAAMFRVVSRL